MELNIVITIGLVVFTALVGIIINRAKSRTIKKIRKFNITKVSENESLTEILSRKIAEKYELLTTIDEKNLEILSLTTASKAFQREIIELTNKNELLEEGTKKPNRPSKYKKSDKQKLKELNQKNKKAYNKKFMIKE